MQGLTPVGTPNRTPRRTGKAKEPSSFSTPQHPRTEEGRAPSDPPIVDPGSTFAERVYQSTGRIRGKTGAQSLFTTPTGPSSRQDGSAFGSGRVPLMSTAMTPSLRLGGGPIGLGETLSPASRLARLGRLQDTNPSPSLFASPARKQEGAAGLPEKKEPESSNSALVAAGNKGKPEPDSAIPQTVVDLPSQRLYAVAVLAFLLAWKTYDATALSVDSERTSSVYLFLKWCVLDTGLWYACWRLHIPRLSITARAMQVLTALSVFVNLNLFFLSSSIFMLAVKPVAISVASTCVRAIEQIPLVGPRLVGDSDLLIDSFELDGEHILGRHTIHVLPHSLAHMNPDSRIFCIDAKKAGARSEPWYWAYVSDIVGPYREKQTKIPILINGTHPQTITYAYTSFATGQRQVRAVKNVGAMQIETTTVYPTLNGWSMALYYLPVSEVGVYEIQSVRDAGGLEFRTPAHAPKTVVVGCPRARLQWRADPTPDDGFAVGGDGHASICQRIDADDTAASGGLIEAVVEGYEPIEITMVRLVNGHREVIGLEGIHPRIAEEEEEAAKAADAGGEKDTQAAEEIVRWARFRARRSVYVINDTFLRPGEYVYKLESVRDAANFTASLSDASSSTGVFKNNKGRKDAVGKATSFMARIHVHRRPSAAWASALLQSEMPLRLSGDKQRSSSHRLGLALVGQPPWTVEYLVIEASGTTRETRRFASASEAFIEAGRAGVYQLESVGDQHCAGRVERANVTVADTPRPTMNVTSTALTARECGGSIGAQLDLELVGRPPFVVHYRESNLRFPSSRPITRVVRTQQRRHSVRVTPELAGTYRFEFFRLEDDNYPSGIPVSAPVVEQPVHAQPSAKLDTVGGAIPRRICRGQTLELPVRLKGQGPWELTYAVVHESRRTTHTVAGIGQESHAVALGPLESPGDYAVEIVQVRDGNGCARDLVDVGTTVTVRADGPSVAFRCAQDIRVLDGTQARIPIRVAGEFPVRVRYRKAGDASGHEYTAEIARASHDASVLAYGPGEYELVAAADMCPGSVDPQAARCAVRVEPRPAAWFATDGLARAGADAVWRLPEVCEGAAAPAVFELGLSGSGPWKLEYGVQFWAAGNQRAGDARHADRSAVHTAVALQPSTLKTECCDPGLYRYTLRGVSDERYGRLQPLAAVRTAAIGASDTAVARVTVAEHRVARAPRASLRAYLPDGTPLAAAATTDSPSSRRGVFGGKRPTAVKHCLAPGQSAADGDAQTWAQVRHRVPEFRVEFEADGAAPFDAWVEVFPATGPSEVVHIAGIAGHSHPVELPRSVAAQLGRFHMRLVRTRDARGCERQLVDPSAVGLGRPGDGSGAVIAGGFEIEYIEAPSARPVPASAAASATRDVCVGDVLSFELRGLSQRAWTVGYVYNGAARTVSAAAKRRVFRRLADVPGNFTLARVCHQDDGPSGNGCCSDFDAGLSYAVHDVPRVRVSGGRDVHQDVMEGDTGDIRLDLVGTPPFSFTWQRRALGASGKILESHTVADLNASSYTITTAAEGTFEVTFVQDRYCQYPKA
ncbi:hypothetical protein GGH99_004126 [Coemansia sp. RSA 1285]|nr:hypothetical protein GGH99_004126 [Coemansia sp. RSA 1285]